MTTHTRSLSDELRPVDAYWCHKYIQATLKQQPLTIEIVNTAQRIFDRATDDNLWGSQRSRSWSAGDKDYKADSQRAIDIARQSLHPKKGSQLVFEKVPVTLP
jgi:hypothetical protein